jgi:CheY-like chemotaxis protein
VDDSEIARQSLRRVIERFGIEVLEAGDGSQGLTVARENEDIQIVFTDIHMPKLSGLDMCAGIRALPHGADVALFVISADADAVNRARGRQLGVTAWMIKPVTEAMLESVMTKVTSTHRA